MRAANLTVALTLLAGFALSACEQPRPRCSIARGQFAARYILRGSSGSCTPLLGERLSVQAYTAPRSASDSRPDFDKTSVAIQPSSLTNLLLDAAGRAENAPGASPYALGAFDDNVPDEDDYCTVPTLSTARVRLPSLSEVMDQCTTHRAAPSVDVSYEFRNVRVYTTAGAYGTQFSAELTYRSGDCLAEYLVTALYPAVECGAPEPTTAADGGSPESTEDASGIAPPALDAGLDAQASPPEASDGGAPPEAPCLTPEPSGALVTDDSLCAASADPTMGRAIGSGINPDFAVFCDPDLLLCLLRDTPAVR